MRLGFASGDFRPHERGSSLSDELRLYAEVLAILNKGKNSRSAAFGHRTHDTDNLQTGLYVSSSVASVDRQVSRQVDCTRGYEVLR